MAGFSDRLNAWLDRQGWPQRKRPRRLADITGHHYNTATRWLTENPALTVPEIARAARAIDPACPAELIAWLAVDGMVPPWAGVSPTDCWRQVWDAARRMGAFAALSGSDAAALAALLQEKSDQGLPPELLADALVQAATQKADRPA